jgi:hypothetical protein
MSGDGLSSLKALTGPLLLLGLSTPDWVNGARSTQLCAKCSLLSKWSGFRSFEFVLGMVRNPISGVSLYPMPGCVLGLKH